MTRCGVDDEVCGLRSAIPPCCRAWFQVWQAFLATAPRRLVGRDHWVVRDRWNYIGCPGCRQCGAKVLTRDCPCPLEAR
jgi:hypothetical protein